jgi:transposase-like protein
MAIEKDLLDQLLAGRDPKDVFNKDGLVDELKKALSERILNAEIDEHLEGEGGEAKGNHRNVKDDPFSAARSGGDFRSQADCQISAPVPGLR